MGYPGKFLASQGRLSLERGSSVSLDTNLGKDPGRRAWLLEKANTL
ncbi:hypothetical protein CYA_0897 [Synechococcus sp. JA-3-3Ab]|nr:hypothetical protein CYA_0897 [Synechococcus sp. JA-3-3Ab]